MIFKNFESTDIVSGRVQPVSTGMFENGEVEENLFFTSSIQSKITGSSIFEPLNGLYYINLFTSSSIDVDPFVSVTYGHHAGSGSSSEDLDEENGSFLRPTQAIYNQYRNFLLVPDDRFFTFFRGSNVSEIDSVDIYALNFSSAKVKDRLDPGQFQLTLSGSNGTFTFIDDSRNIRSGDGTAGGRRFNMVSGSLASGAELDLQGEVNYTGLGSMYPDLGVILFNPVVLSGIVGTIDGVSLTTPTATQATGTPFALKHQLLAKSIIKGQSLIARVTEFVPARHYFVRVKNQEFNYSNNPTFVFSQREADSGQVDSADIGKIRFEDFVNDPQIYVTTVGLYNDNNDLLAVAKLSQPALKNFSNELLVKIRLDA
jgi:hypothetical protein